MADNNRVRGVCKWFNNGKGYGFIAGPKGEDVFVHYTSINSAGYRSLNEGDEVEYTVIQSDKGLAAQDVILVSASTASMRGGK